MYTTINTHEFVKEFIKASNSKSHSTEKQAEIIANTINKSQQMNFQKPATKKDLEILEQKITGVLDIKISQLTNKIAAMIILAVGVIAWLDKIIS